MTSSKALIFSLTVITNLFFCIMSELIFTVRFGVGIDALLEILEVLAIDAFDEWVEGNDVEWTVPYRIGGRAWIDVPIIGRFGLDFGPMEGEWVL